MSETLIEPADSIGLPAESREVASEPSHAGTQILPAPFLISDVNDEPTTPVVASRPGAHLVLLLNCRLDLLNCPLDERAHNLTRANLGFSESTI
jgi:hypothetical protein